MKLASRIHPRRTNKSYRAVTVLGTEYRFEKTVGKTGEAHYVADVENKQHAKLLLAGGQFYEFTGKTAPAETLQRPPVQQEPETIEHDPIDEAVIAEAEALIEGSVADIGRAIGNVSSIAVIRAALVAETDSETPRKTVIELFGRALEGAQQAGVQD
ncbi:MAG: hypothetical protein L0H83_11460 [Salinisphaera sp.]|nr:hypothetical protein [Salinisphaera sp.]